MINRCPLGELRCGQELSGMHQEWAWIVALIGFCIIVDWRRTWQEGLWGCAPVFVNYQFMFFYKINVFGSEAQKQALTNLCSVRPHCWWQKSTVKNEDTFNGLRRYLHRLTKVSSSANEGIFIKMAGFSLSPCTLTTNPSVRRTPIPQRVSGVP